MYEKEGFFIYEAAGGVTSCNLLSLPFCIQPDLYLTR